MLINQVSQLVGVEKFYLKVGELLYNKGGMISDGVVAGKRIDERVSEHAERHRRVINPSVGELVAMLGQVDELQEVQQRYMTKRIIEGAPAEIAKKEAEGITKEVVKKVAAIKQKIITAQKKVAEKAKEIGQKTEQIKLFDGHTQQQLQAEIMKCCYIGELDEVIKQAAIEEQSAMQEYENYSKTLQPKVKSYFDGIMKSVGEFCHQFNDFMQKSSDITDMYLYLDDTLTDEFSRHEIKEAIINREIREKRNNWLELAEAGLRTLEFTSIAGTANIMKSATRDLKLLQMVQSGKDLTVIQRAKLESMIIKEAQKIFSSKELQLLKEAHDLGKSFTVKI